MKEIAATYFTTGRATKYSPGSTTIDCTESVPSNVLWSHSPPLITILATDLKIS